MVHIELYMQLRNETFVRETTYDPVECYDMYVSTEQMSSH